MNISIIRSSIAALVFAAGFSPASAQTELRVASTVRQIFDNLPLYVAQEAGLYKKHNLKVQITHFSGGGEVVRAVVGAAADVGMVGTSAAIIAASRGTPLKLISAWSAPAFGIVFIAAQNSSINTVKDLDGKRVGFTRPGSVSHTGIAAAMKETGVKPQLVPVGGDGWAFLKAGRVDATWHTAPDVYSLVDSKEAKIVFEISQYLKDYQQGALAAMAPVIKSKSDELRRFLTAIEEANALIVKDPDFVSKIGQKSMDVPGDKLKDMIIAAPKGFFTIGPISQANFNGSLTEAVAAGGLPKESALKDVADFSLLPARK